MIEESELAKSIRLGEAQQVRFAPRLFCNLTYKISQGDVDISVRAQECITQLTDIVSSKSISSPSPPSKNRSDVAEVSKNAKAVISELGTVIQQIDDPALMEQLLDFNDQITTLLSDLPAPSRPVLTLHGLGLNFNNSPSEGSGAKTNGLPNGHVPGNGTPLSDRHDIFMDDDDLTPTTPRVDKGKGKAEPEPEEPEKVLSPTLLPESEDEDEDGPRRFIPIEDPADVASPTDR